jgi:hypothetical protein
MSEEKSQGGEKICITLKDLRNDFYRCRDFELSHLWQRSVFLTAFLVLCFTGYGHILMQILAKCHTDGKLLILNEIAAGIALTGIVFSIIWIMMAKSSKSWYEVYEGIIVKMENEPELRIPENYIMGEYAESGVSKCDSNLLTCNSGRYSPSKLNIFIGIVLFVIWIVIFTAHVAILATCVLPKNQPVCIDHAYIFYILVAVFGVVILTAMFNTWAKSNTL